MREILFRAKRKDNGEWVEGYYIYHIKRTPSPAGDCVKPEDEQHVIMCDGFSDWNMPRDTVYFDIDPDTLCQYTGLKDKNGNRIWENDIVYIRNSGLSGYGTVEYENGCLVVKDVKRGRTYSLFGDWQLRMDGNIFDNPELLKAEYIK